MADPLGSGEPSPEVFAFRAVDDAICRGDYAEAFRVAWPWAEKGQDWAENCIGSLYHLGFGVEADPAKAFYFYYRAARQGNGGAWQGLATLFECGAPGFPADSRMAEHCRERVRESGYVLGQPHKLARELGG